MRFFAIIGFLVWSVASTSAEELHFKNIDEVKAKFANRPLCFIGVLDEYTDVDEAKINPHANVVRGMKFSLLWSAKKNPPKIYWMHICGEPRVGQIFGKCKKMYAVTLEGPAHHGKIDTQNWAGCADAYKFTPIVIEQGHTNQPSTKHKSKDKPQSKSKDRSQ